MQGTVKKEGGAYIYTTHALGGELVFLKVEEANRKEKEGGMRNRVRRGLITFPPPKLEIRSYILRTRIIYTCLETKTHLAKGTERLKKEKEENITYE